MLSSVMSAVQRIQFDGWVRVAASVATLLTVFTLSAPAAPASPVAVVAEAKALTPEISLVQGDRHESPVGAESTWKVAFVVFGTSVSGAVMPSDVKSVNRSWNGLDAFVQTVFLESDGRLGVQVDVFEAMSPWPGARMPLPQLAGYDVVAYRYPMASTEPFPTDIGLSYAGLAGVDSNGVFYQEFPAVVDSTCTWVDSPVLFHEFLHSVTQFLFASGAVQDADLPVGNVHGQTSSQTSEMAFYGDYLRGEVKVDGRLLGLTVDRVVDAGTPVSVG